MSRRAAPQLALNMDEGTLSFETDALALRGATPSVTILVGPEESVVKLLPQGSAISTAGCRHTPAGPTRERSWRWMDERGYSLTWTVSELAILPGFTLRAVFYNGSDDPVRLRELGLCETPEDGLVYQGEPSNWWLLTLGFSSRSGHLGQVLPSVNEDIRRRWEGFNMPVPHELPADERSNDGHWRAFRDWATLYTDRGKRGLTLGAVGPGVADVRLAFRVNQGKIKVDIASEMTDVLVDPGQSCRSEEVLILAAPYDAAVETLLRWVAATHGHRTHCGPVFGWCSWYDMGRSITAGHVEAVSRAVADLRDRIPMQVIQVDDGFQRQVGDWTCNERFPEGWRPVVEGIRAADASPGIWLAPLAAHDSLGLIEKHPDWFQRDAQGELAGSANNWGPTSHWLDPTHPQVQEFLRRTIREARDAGFQYFKIDFNHVDGRMYNPHKTRLQAYRDLYRLYREEMGEESYLLACTSLTRGEIGFADAARIGPDSSARWRAPHPCCIQDCIRAVGSSALVNSILLANDPDVTYAKPRRSLTQAEWQTWHSFVGLLGGAAIISEPMHQPEYREAVRMVEILNPPALERGRSFHAGTDREHRRFGFVAQRPWGNYAVVLLYNPDEAPADVTLDVEELDCLGPAFHVWSFWDEKYLGIADASFVARELPPHGPALLRLTALSLEEDMPVLVGSNLHLSMGSAEIADVAATSTHMTIALTDGGAREGKLYIYSRRPLTLMSASGCIVPSISREGEHVWGIHVSVRRRGSEQLVGLFARSAE